MSRKPQRRRPGGASGREARGASFRVLAIAGLDPGGGAGLAADLRTVAALGGHGMAALTAVTVQDSREVRSVTALPARLVRAQVEAVLDDIGADAVKIGMLGSGAVVRAVAGALRARGAHPVVLDPVLRATSGRALLDGDGRALLVRLLFPLADLVTPNLPEASALLGRRVAGARQMPAAARALLDLGARAVLLKGGHLRGRPLDLFTDGVTTVTLAGERIATPHTHGGGCVLASAIACFLARGATLVEAVRLGKRFVTAAIRASYRLGAGRGPVDPLRAGRRFALREAR
jgi:hydroxymethylpyrimidine kinase/phosphomethylpyrimidine kinase